MNAVAPSFIFNTGIIICGASAAAAVITLITLRFYKTRLQRQLDDDYGKQGR
jgi:hypothetical membrane protein